MTDKDQFVFDEDDDFPEISKEDQHASPELDVSDDDFPDTDLSSSFADGEHTASAAGGEDQETKAQMDGGPKPRPMLMILLLVVIGAAGAYYFMGMGGTEPTVPTVSVPAQTATKSVALPPKPAPEPSAPSQAEPPANPVPVTATPVQPAAETAAPAPPQPVAAPGSPPAAAEQPVGQQGATASTPEPAMPLEAQPATAEPGPGAAAQATAAVAKPQLKPAPPAAAAETTPDNTAAAKPMPAPVPKQVAGGAYSLDAGSYLFESNRDSLVDKIKKLGYEPFISPVDATLDMTRLRLGTYNKEEIQQALAFARTIEPGSYSTQAGDRYIVYAGTFLRSGNVAKLSKRFLDEGITVHPEPVQVVRTLSRIRFGRFASKEDAAAAARDVQAAGLQVEVVKSK